MHFLPFQDLTPFHEGYAESLGRALVLCQHFESCAHHVMVVYAITDRMREGEYTSEQLRKLAVRLRKVTLGGSVKRLDQSGDFGDPAAILERGRQARNWLVHEAGDVIQANGSIGRLVGRLREFMGQVDALCEADQILSIASYEISEREPARYPSRSYSRGLRNWVLAPVIGAIRHVARSNEHE